MSDEAALLAAVCAHPDEDTPRLAYADWLDEHHPAPAAPARGKKRKRGGAPNPRAELIRLQIELDRLGPYDTSSPTKDLRDRADHLLHEHARDWTADFGTAVSRWTLQPTFRRGFPDHLGIPARWFVEHGEAIRRTLPLLASLTVYRLNGWGQRFAQSLHLRGLRELKVSCWASGADITALANSPHLRELERLTLWASGWERTRDVCMALGGSKAWPRLNRLALMWNKLGPQTELVNDEANRPLAVNSDPLDRTFPFASDFDHTFFVGRIADGRQVFAACPWIGQTTIPVLLFDAAGNRLEQRSLPVPAKHVLRDKRRNETWPMFAARRDATFQKHRELVCEQLGAEPADIRVRRFDLEGSGIVCGVGHMSTQAENALYQLDDPEEDLDASPYGPRNGEELGVGGAVAPWIGDHGMFTFTPGDGANPYFIGGRGRIVGR
jgi:uncharacterized protein (TIGR02996 family)